MHHRLLRSAFAAHAGYIAETQGDAFLVLFQRATDAVAAAVDGQRALAGHAWPEHEVIRVRMGLHTGEPTRTENRYAGVDLHRCARLAGMGQGGQVLISQVTQALIRDRLPAGTVLQDWGEHRLKDLRHSERIFQLVLPGLLEAAPPAEVAENLTSVDRVLIRDSAQPRPLATATAALLAAVRSDNDTVALTPEQARDMASARPADLQSYRLGRIAEWSLPRYQLDGRFVALSLLMDEGEDEATGRWSAQPAQYADLRELLDGLPDPAVVVLGPPGGGKSTLLRRLEMDTAVRALRGEDPLDTVTFFIQLNQYKADHPGGQPLPPGEWLAERWAATYPDLPALDDLLAEGRGLLLLDALNEMPAADDATFRRQVSWWKDWLVRLARERPGNRIVFSCRTLDYSAPLSTPELRVPQTLIEPLDDQQVRAFFQLYSPMLGEDLWRVLAGTPQLEALRSPYFLALLVDQAEATGTLAPDRAALFTGFVRQALKRETERDNPLFAVAGLLTTRDLRRLAQWQWRDEYELPERGVLVPKLSTLAFGMQSSTPQGAACQIREDYDAALDLIADQQGEEILKAGMAVAVLDEDPAADEVLFRHQLLQEYFAGRVLAAAPRTDLVASEWRAASVRPSLRDVLATLPVGETLPPLPTTAWEETTVLAATMMPAVEDFITDLMKVNVALAARCAIEPSVFRRLPDTVVHDLRLALVQRSQDPEADLRSRLEVGLALGTLGDPRFERRQGPHGAYLMPPMATISAGDYTIGEDEPIPFSYPGASGQTTAHMPRHTVTLAQFAIGRFPVTNAEYSLFVAAGGYSDERWWTTTGAAAWFRGELANEGAKANNRQWRQRFQEDPALFERMVEDGRFASSEAVARWREWLGLDDAAFEAALSDRWRPQREIEPRFARDGRFNNPALPVVGITWYEAAAYADWLSTQSGIHFQLPTEVQWEAAARRAGRLDRLPGTALDPLSGNTAEIHWRRPSPVGVFLDGDTADGVSDLLGNVNEWTRSCFGRAGDGARFAYPYQADDGREDEDTDEDVEWVVRGGSWRSGGSDAHPAAREGGRPTFWNDDVGLRLASS